MSSSKKISEDIFRKGPAAKISKFDQQNAYKMVPCPFHQLRLQGFYWLGKYWVELRQVFGAISAVWNYDSLHLCVSLIAEIVSNIDKSDLHRTLDDQVVVSTSTDRHKDFIRSYIDICDQLNIPLASMDGTKAFLYQDAGTILGVWFDTNTLSWSLCTAKIDAYIIAMERVRKASKISLKSLQSVNGIINHLIQHCPAMKFFRAPIIDDIKRADKAKRPITPSPATIDTLAYWQNMLHDLRHGFPIPDRDFKPDGEIQFVTDAAGLQKNHALSHPIGVGSVGVKELKINEHWFASQALWPEKFITSTKDNKNAFIGNKSTTLEILGWFPPLYHNRHLIRNRGVIIHVDNMASMFAYKAGRCSHDAWASFLITSLAFVLTSLSCHLEVRFLPRVSIDNATWADLLSRRDAKGLRAIDALQTPLTKGWPPTVGQWMENPYFDPIFKWKLLADFLEG